MGQSVSRSNAFAALVLAAGEGSRFRSETGEELPKVLRPILGRPMVFYVLDTLASAGISDVTLVVGYRAAEVMSAIGDKCDYVLQDEQRGSGHAVACARDKYGDFDGHLVVKCGDSPLFAGETVREMMRTHVETGAAATLAAAVLSDPFGYGRILRDGGGRIAGVVEEKCASAEERKIKEVNGGAYAFDAKWLFGSIDAMALNVAGEYNLTDMVRVAVEQKRTVSAVRCAPEELLGVNTPDQLRIVEDTLKRSIST